MSNDEAITATTIRQCTREFLRKHIPYLKVTRIEIIFDPQEDDAVGIRISYSNRSRPKTEDVLSAVRHLRPLLEACAIYKFPALAFKSTRKIELCAS